MDAVPLWLLFVASVLLVLACVEGGFRLGAWRHRIALQEKESAASPLGGATLALLGFVLAFTFSLASSRFDDRRRAVVDEANAIGTAYYRTDVLAEPARAQSRALYREYIEWRIGKRGTDIEAAGRESQRIQNELWAICAAAMNADPHSEAVARYMDALNETIDMHSVRMLVAVNSRIPVPLWLGLYLLTVFSMGAIGYSAGLSETTRTPAVVPLALAFSLVLWLIADLDRPQEGLLLVSQAALESQRDSMLASP